MLFTYFLFGLYHVKCLFYMISSIHTIVNQIIYRKERGSWNATYICRDWIDSARNGD